MSTMALEEPYPRSQSVMQTRSSSFQTKASRILQKVSNFRGRIRLASRSGKAEDDSHMNLHGSPYLRQTRSMDVDRHSKPYMSQPMLTIPNMLEPDRRDSRDSEAEGYSSSSSPQHSPARVGFKAAAANGPNSNNNIHSAKTVVDDLPKQSATKPLMSGVGTEIGLAERNVGFDGLPVSGGSSSFLHAQSPALASRSSSSQTAKPHSLGLSRSTSKSQDDFNRRYQNQLAMTMEAPHITVSPASADAETAHVKATSGGNDSVSSYSASSQSHSTNDTCTGSSRPSFTSHSSASSVHSVGKASVNSSTSTSESFKSFETDTVSRPGSSMGQAAFGIKKEGASVPSSASSFSLATSLSAVTITQSKMKEKEQSPKPSTLPSKTPRPASPSKSSLFSKARPPSPGPSSLSSKNATKSHTSSPPTNTNIPSSSKSPPSNTASSTTTRVPQPTHGSIPWQSQHDQRPSPPPLKRPATSPAPISPSQFTSFSSIVEPTPSVPIPIPQSSPSSSSPQQQQQTPTQTQSAITPRQTQAVPLPAPVSLSSSLPTRRPTIPRLTTPLPGHRFSLHLAEGDGQASARLSPSIIIRQPVLPLLNLPTLNPAPNSNEVESPSTRYRRPRTSPNSSGFASGSSGSGSSGGNSNGSGARLKHMPALPMAGTGRGVSGREEDDMDMDSDDDDVDDVDDEEDNDHEHDAGDGEDDEDGDEDDSFESQDREQGDRQRKGSLVLPMVDMSRIDLASIFERKTSAKGKEKEVQPVEDSWAAKTPTQTGGVTPSGSKTPRYTTSSSIQKQNVQQQDYFSAKVPSARFSVHGTPSSVGMTPWGDKGKPVQMTPTPMPVPVPGKPGLYKHASRSMLDIPGFAVGGTTNVSPSTASAARPKTSGDATSASKDGVLDGVKEMTRKTSREWIRLGKKKSRETMLKEEFEKMRKENDSKGKEKEKTTTTPNASAPAQIQPIASNRDDLILEEPRRLGGAAIAAAAANITIPAPAIHEPIHQPNAQARPHVPETETNSLTTTPSQIRRRRSMPSFTASSPPPPYPAFPLKYHTILQLPPGSYEMPPTTPPPPATPHSPINNIISAPTGEEGTEKLPPYTNEIYLRAIMPRKMEFTKPGVQAKDRKWRRVICELEGTVFRVYRCPPELSGQGKVADWWERKVGVGDVSVGQGIGGGTAANGTVTVSGATGPLTEEEQRRKDEERERVRREKLESEASGSIGQMHTSIRLPPTPRIEVQPSLNPSLNQGSPTQQSPGRDVQRGRDPYRIGNADSDSPPPTKSRFASFLKPVKTHHRSQSDLPSTPRTSSAPRSSFNIPRPSFGASSSSDLGDISSTSNSTPAMSNPSLSLSVPNSASMASSQSSLLAPPQTAPPSVRSTSTTRSRASSRAPPPNYPPGVTCAEPDKNDLIRAYTMQNAESGLGNDYVKRKNVIRVRLEQEQFLLQARDVTEVVDWIEGLHAATNVALDLDLRPMPRGPMFPRRRRRRPRRTETTTGTGDNVAADNNSTAAAG